MRRQMISIMKSLVSDDPTNHHKALIELSDHFRSSLQNISCPVDNSDGTTTIVWSVSSPSNPTTASAVIKSRQPLWAILEAAIPGLVHPSGVQANFAISKIDCEAIALQCLIHANLSCLKALRLTSLEEGNWSWLASPTDLLESSCKTTAASTELMPDILTRNYASSPREGANQFVKSLALCLIVNLMACGLTASVTSALSLLMWSLNPSDLRAVGNEEHSSSEEKSASMQSCDLLVDVSTFRSLGDMLGEEPWIVEVLNDWKRCPPIECTIPELILMLCIDRLLDCKELGSPERERLKEELMASCVNCVGFNQYNPNDQESQKLVAHIFVRLMGLSGSPSEASLQMIAYVRRAAPVVLWAVRLMSLLSVDLSLNETLKKMISQKISCTPFQGIGH